MKYQIGELSLGEVLDQAVKVVQDGFGLLFGIVLVFQLPVLLIVAVVTIMMGAGVQQIDPNDPAAAEQLMATLMPQLMLLLGLAVVALLTIPITQAAIIHAISKKYMGETTTIGECYSTAFSRIVPLFITWIMVFVVVMIGYVLCVIPGIIFSLWFGLVGQVVVIEGLSGADAMKRSKELVTGNMLTFFVLGLVLFLINFLVSMAFNFIPSVYVQQLVGAVVNTILALFGSAATVVFYFSCRSKLENFDVTVLARSFGLEKMGQNFDASPKDKDQNPYS